MIAQGFSETPDFDEASFFLSVLDPSTNVFTFQTFDDVKLADGKGRKLPHLARTLHGTLKDLAPTLAALNAEGAGVYVTVNETDGKGRQLENIKRPRAVWQDDDVGSTIDFIRPPTLTIATSPGKFQRLWIVEGLSREDHRAIMETMIAKFGSDKGAKDLARVLRLPGFYHRKGAPFRSSIIAGLATTDDTTKPYSRDEILAAFPPMVTPTPGELRLEGPQKIAGARAPGFVDDDSPAVEQAAREYLQRARPAIMGEHGDNQTIEVACFLRNLGCSPELSLALLLELYNPKCDPPWEHDELVAKVESAAKRAMLGRDAPGIHFGVIEHPPGHVPAVPAVPKNRLLFPDEISVEKILELRSRALIDDLIIPGELSVLYGDSGAGKTFLALDMCWAIARGEKWQGRDVTQAPVLYVSLEGVDGFDMRTRAIMQERGDTGRHFARLTFHPSLIRSDAGAQGAIEIVNAVNDLTAASGQKAALVVIDTMARAMAGDDENAAEAMMYFVENRAGLIQRETGAAVLVVHHKSKAGDIRGSGALRGACDCVLRADRSEAGQRSLAAEKVKDGQEGELFRYNLSPVVILKPDGKPAMKKNGEPLKSCVVEVTNAIDDEKRMIAEVLAYVREREEAGDPASTARQGKYVLAAILARGSKVDTPRYQKVIDTLRTDRRLDVIAKGRGTGGYVIPKH